MKDQCPFFKKKCLGNQCVMWKDETCLVVSFMENFVGQPPAEFERPEPLGFEMETREVEVPTEIKLATPEELAAKLIDFTQKEFPDEDRRWIRNISQLFWRSKNIERWNIPADIQLKIEKAELLAQKQLDSEREVREREQLEKEKTELPSLVSSCVDWAKDHSLKRITKADVEAFLLEKNIEILPQTQRSLYAMANVEIKSKSY